MRRPSAPAAREPRAIRAAPVFTGSSRTSSLARPSGRSPRRPRSASTSWHGCERWHVARRRDRRMRGRPGSLRPEPRNGRAGGPSRARPSRGTEGTAAAPTRGGRDRRTRLRGWRPRASALATGTRSTPLVSTERNHPSGGEPGDRAHHRCHVPARADPPTISSAQPGPPPRAWLRWRRCASLGDRRPPVVWPGRPRPCSRPPGSRRAAVSPATRSRTSTSAGSPRRMPRVPRVMTAGFWALGLSTIGFAAALERRLGDGGAGTRSRARCVAGSRSAPPAAAGATGCRTGRCRANPWNASPG